MLLALGIQETEDGKLRASSCDSWNAKYNKKQGTATTSKGNQEKILGKIKTKGYDW